MNYVPIILEIVLWDDFPIFGSPLAHLEPKLELFEVWDDGDDDLSHHYLPVSSLGLFFWHFQHRAPVVPFLKHRT